MIQSLPGNTSITGLSDQLVHFLLPKPISIISTIPINAVFLSSDFEVIHIDIQSEIDF